MRVTKNNYLSIINNPALFHFNILERVIKFLKRNHKDTQPEIYEYLNKFISLKKAHHLIKLGKLKINTDSDNFFNCD